MRTKTKDFFEWFGAISAALGILTTGITASIGIKPEEKGVIIGITIIIIISCITAITLVKIPSKGP